MFAAIDMGSNSFRLHIAEYIDGKIRVIRSARESNRIAAGLDKKNKLSQESMLRGIDALSNLRKILDAYPLSDVKAVATNTFRIASNAKEFLAQAEHALGYPIEVVSGEEEGRLIYFGLSHVFPDEQEKRLVIDIGGGSTEIIFGQGQKIMRAESFGIGTVAQSLSFFHEGHIDKPSFDAAILSARSLFEDVADFYRSCGWSKVYGSSGTIRATAEILKANDIGDGRLTEENLQRLKQRMIHFGSLDKLKLDGVKSERVSSILGGLTILLVLMADFKISEIVPVEAGLRMGVLWDTALKLSRNDRRETSVKMMLTRYHVDQKRAARLAEYAISIYKNIDKEQNSTQYMKLLYWSALMHEIGIFISPTGYHKHGAYLIEHADMAGFTRREQFQMSRLVLGQMGNLRKLNGIMATKDATYAIVSLRLAVMLAHAKVAYKADKLLVRVTDNIDVTLPKQWLEDYPTMLYWLERECDWWNDVGMRLNIKSI